MSLNDFGERSRLRQVMNALYIKDYFERFIIDEALVGWDSK
jgi:hypothetical protein